MTPLSHNSNSNNSNMNISGDENSNSKNPANSMSTDDNDSTQTPTHFNFHQWAQLPKPTFPPANEFQPVEKFIADAILSRHEQNIHSTSNTNTNNNNTNNSDTATKQDAVAGYNAIIDLLRKRDDIPMLTKLLLAFTTSGNGTTMNRLSSEHSKHSRLIHYIFKLNPFQAPSSNRKLNKDTTSTSRSLDNNSISSATAITNQSSSFELLDAYLNLIIALVSANSVFLTPALNSVWTLIHQTIPCTPLDNVDTMDYDDDKNNEGDYSNSKDNPTINVLTTSLSQPQQQKQQQNLEQTRQELLQRNARLHGTLSKILHLVPKGKSELFPIISSSFPFKLRPIQQQISYVKHCLLTLHYVPTIHQPFMELLMDRCLEIDVEIRIANDGIVLLELQQQRKEGDNNEQDDDYNIFDDLVLDGKYTVHGTTVPNIIASSQQQQEQQIGEQHLQSGQGIHEHTNNNHDPQAPEIQNALDKVDEMAEKLDSLMCIAFHHLESCASNAAATTTSTTSTVSISSSTISKSSQLFTFSFPNPISKTPRQLYKMIIQSFNSVILTTHRSKFVQFVIFYLCGLDHEYHSLSITSTTTTDMTNENDYDLLDTSNDGIIRNTNTNSPSPPPPPTTTTTEPLPQTKLYREFAAKLIEIILDPLCATITRQSAVCYLASFISRANYVCAETTCEAISALLRFAEAYMETFPTEASARNAWRGIDTIMDGSSNGRSGDGGNKQQSSQQVDLVDMHSLFYTACQGAFYIMCFRGKECIHYYRKAVKYYESLELQKKNENKENCSTDHYSEDDDDEFLLYSHPTQIDISSERWTRVCSHHLHPLRHCLESVRGEFLLLADSFHIMDEHLINKLIIEDRKMASTMEMLTNNQKSHASTSTHSARGGRRRMMSNERKSRGVSITTAATVEKKRLTGGIGGVGGLGKGKNPLDSFFPFDPYLLRNSNKYVDAYYRHWEGSAINDHIDDTDDEYHHEKYINGDNVEVEDEEGDSIMEEDVDSDTSDNDEEDEVDDDHSDEEEEDDMIVSTMLATKSRRRERYESLDGDDDDADSDVSASEADLNVPKDSWVQELKRARALSLSEDCW